jgi:hypothetical protein
VPNPHAAADVEHGAVANALHVGDRGHFVIQREAARRRNGLSLRLRAGIDVEKSALNQFVLRQRRPVASEPCGQHHHHHRCLVHQDLLLESSSYFGPFFRLP